MPELTASDTDEIADLAIEMHMRLNNTWVESDEDILCREKYKHILKKYDYDKVEMPVICSSFLRKYSQFLEI